MDTGNADALDHLQGRIADLPPERRQHLDAALDAIAVDVGMPAPAPADEDGLGALHARITGLERDMRRAAEHLSASPLPVDRDLARGLLDACEHNLPRIRQAIEGGGPEASDQGAGGPRP